ncbi:WXG100 family type VII secretion target [Streptomyces sp. 900116325]|jgi:WXG100 family type VII secretion target|uniref:WXG100 family type VII secretion target n=1 Tax=Streptomyces sp. NBC_01217 TaxID=2903779 RepID=UPI002E0ED8F9|nr:WXG100 family type VII secretion target [Streptomyces sp. NBC_01217]WSQ62547.1 WXG100 family type VII secretion target [Streptomyces sp. NBC_01217]
MAATDGGDIGFKGSDGVLYQTTPEDLKVKAGDIRTTEQTVQAELDALKSYVVGLEAKWKGVASSTFQELMKEWDTYAAQLQNALLAIANGLDSTADNYLGSEHSNLKNLSAVNLPKANLV